MGFSSSGKGTQAKLLEKYGFAHFSSGNLIRESKDLVIIKYREGGDYEKGILLSDELLFELLEKALQKSPEKYILDGFIRNVTQAQYAKRNELVDLVFYFKVNKETATKRMLKRGMGRTDDTLEAIEGKFNEFKKKTEPTLKYLRKNFEFYEINADLPIKKIHNEVLKVLKLSN